ncbi:MAG TPA: NAD-dependent succinate-semialdehyde dehydrogenase [Bryobacteraceae bacterium]|nr:NAD-dependent succinate-semialdehyde dehydrogenase [Bryobacteraceae bacterium]
MIASVNPFDGVTVKTFEPISDRELERRLDLAHRAFLAHRKTSFADRAAKLLEASRIIESEKSRFGALMTVEMGKTISAAEAEAKKCAWVCRYYAENGEQALAQKPIPTNASRSFVRYEPLGPVLAVMPWNFPFWQVFRFAAPALMAGNTGLLKHASNVPQCALAIEEIFLRAGFPEGVFQTLLIGSSKVAGVIADDRVAAVTLTGSEPAGRSVASHAGQHIKKTVLELGGSDPFIIMPSANLKDAVSTAVKARVINNGQSCIAAKRFIIADAIYDSCEREFVQQMRALKVGDPMDPSTELGPLATEQILADLEDQVQRAVSAGARLLTGGRRVSGGSLTYEPTALADVPRSSPVSCEEFFGPVAMLFRVKDAREAIEVANSTPFGLGASAWTQDPAEQQLFIEGIESGQVFINAMVASDPRVPFGGVKNSGYGRELGTPGIREFVNVKSIWVG